MKGKIIVFLLVGTNFLLAQTGALSFTLLQQSQLLIGAGQIGAAIPNDDILGFYFNPAILGYSARNNHASISFMPDKTEWIFSPDLTYHNYGLNLGYNLKSTKLNLPISVGIGYIHNKVSFGEQLETGIESYDLFDCFSLGVGLDYYLKLNLGISLKSVESKLSLVNDLQYTADATMMDYGALLIFPISDLFMSSLSFQIDNSTILLPRTNISIGYALSNVGDQIYYVDEAQKSPLSRTARLGYTIDFGLDIILNQTKINFFNYSFTAEAEDILIQYSDSEGYKYQDGIGDIKISDHVINLIADENVAVHKGHIFRFFDTFIFASGRFDGHGFSPIKETDGIGFTSKGLFNLINQISDNCSIKFITKHFIIEYFDSNYDTRIDVENNKINFDGLSIHFVGFEI